ncbi:prolipoprotein diacylglyceryl transferase [Chloroflexota bacterium]
MINIDINPVLTIGPVSLRWYGIMVALAVLTIVLWTIRTVSRSKLSYDIAVTAALVGVPSGIIFSRLLHVIDAWEYYSRNLWEIIGGSGLTAWGAVLGAAIGIWIYSKVSKFNFSYFADLIAPGIILAQAVGRVGCIINGCCYGIETSADCAVIYENPESFAPIGIPVHPTHLYELIYNLMVFGVLLMLRGRFRPDGSLFLIYLSLYSAWRIGIGFLRDGTPFLFGLHQAQVIGIIILLITVPLLAYRTRWVRSETNTEGNEEG